MNTGVVLIFYNQADQLVPNFFVPITKLADFAPLVLINNGSKDRTLGSLKRQIQSSGKEISVLDIKKNKDTEASIKIGLRYLLHTQNHEKVGFLFMNDLEAKETLSLFIENCLMSNKEIKTTRPYSLKGVQETEVFSIKEFVEELRLKSI